jgi:hypothetical protein
MLASYSGTFALNSFPRSTDCIAGEDYGEDDQTLGLSQPSCLERRLIEASCEAISGPNMESLAAMGYIEIDSEMG